MPRPRVSLVIPIRNEAGNIGPLLVEIRTALDTAGLEWEVIVVDDGSTDGSPDEVTSLAEPRVRLHTLPGAHGKSAALARGFAVAEGLSVVMLDGDGQDDPAEIPGMIARLTDVDGGVGLVNGWKTPRLDPWHKTIPSRFFNLLVGWLTGLRLHDHNCGLKAMRAEVARDLRLDTGMHRFIPVLAAAAGHTVVEVPVHHRPRLRGVSKYGIARFFHGLYDLGRVLWRTSGQRPRSVGTPAADPTAGLRQAAALLLAVLAVGAASGRILSVSSLDRLALEKRLIDEALGRAVERERAAGTAADAIDRAALRAELASRIRREKGLMRPFLSANDRSRWLTIRALVEQGTFAIDGLVTEPGWDTIDAVAHPDATGSLRLYSSKPPLLSVLCAGPYWLLHRLTGWTLGDHPFEMGRMLLLLFSGLPLWIVIRCTSALVEEAGGTDWGRLWAAGLIAAGTMLSAFVVVLTNHLPAAACVAASGLFLVRCLHVQVPSWRTVAATGLLAACAAAFELPATAWCGVVGLLLLARHPLLAISGALPAMFLVVVASLGSNWLAHGTLTPPYAHRTTSRDAPRELQTAPARPWPPGDSWNPDNWYDYSLTLSNGKVLTSYWRSPSGVDRGEPSFSRYAVHALIGHHGIFSLTPAWLLVPPGLLLLARRPEWRGFAAAVTTVSIVVLAFYLLRPPIDRNYGGVSSGFRWAFWLAPLWTAAAVPAADRLSRSRSGRGLALVLVAISTLSASAPTWNPFTQPWLQQWLIHGGWIAPP